MDRTIPPLVGSSNHLQIKRIDARAISTISAETAELHASVLPHEADLRCQAKALSE